MRFAERISENIDRVQRPGAAEGLRGRLQIIRDRLNGLSAEADVATSQADVDLIRANRDAAQANLQKLNQEALEALSRFPESWDIFSPEFNEEFEGALREFRGNDDLNPSAGLRGGRANCSSHRRDRSKP